MIMPGSTAGIMKLKARNLMLVGFQNGALILKEQYSVFTNYATRIGASYHGP